MLWISPPFSSATLAQEPGNLVAGLSVLAVSLPPKPNYHRGLRLCAAAIGFEFSRSLCASRGPQALGPREARALHDKFVTISTPRTGPHLMHF